MDQALLLRVPRAGAACGVHFKPWGVSPFTGLPAAELHNRWTPVDAVWQRSADRIRNRAGDVASAARILRVLAEELRARLAESPARGLVDEVAMDVVPVVFGSGRRYFGGIDGQHLLEDPHVVIQGDRVLHLLFKVRR